MDTLFTGRSALYLKAVGSTNSYASEMLRQNALPEGFLIYTFDQQNGRGQRGRSWESEPNRNAALSIVLHPKFIPADRQFLLTQIVALAVYDLMAELLRETSLIKIKWPNDIYYGNRKIAGILIENMVRGNQLQSSIAGVGLNINQEAFEAKHAVSVKMISGLDNDLEAVVRRFCSLLEKRYLQARSGKAAIIGQEYLACLFRKDEEHIFLTASGELTGKIKGISPGGRLIVENEGKDFEFDLHEIAFRDLA